MAKFKAIISPLYHRDKKNIKVEIPRDVNARFLIKKVEGWRYSKTHQSFYVPYSKEVFKQLSELFEVEIKKGVEKKPVQLDSNSEEKPINVPIASKFSKDDSPPFLNSKVGNFQTKFKVNTGHSIRLEKLSSQWIKVFVPYAKKGWIESVKNIRGRMWVAEEKYWMVPYVKDSLIVLRDLIGMQNLDFRFKVNPDIPDCIPAYPNQKGGGKTLYDRLTAPQQTEIAKLEERLILERRSPSTIRSYKGHLTGLFMYYRRFAPRSITKAQVEAYILHLIKKKRIAESTQNQIINAIKAYWERVLGKSKEWIDIQRPKMPKKLPAVFSTEEIIDLIAATENLKHKLMLLLIYSAGLRKSELLNLLKRDINIKRRSIHIKSGKGKKDRYVVLAETVVPYLKEYLKQYRPKQWLFEGMHGSQYSGSALQKVFRNAVNASNVNPYGTLHTLRHSYATHCIDQGIGIKIVQEALGHASLQTTEIYLHVSSEALKQLKSPADRLKFK